MIKNLSHMILGVVLGAAIYDLAINLRISYNEDSLKIYCNQGRVFEQVQKGTDVFVKTKNECKTEKGIHNDNQKPKSE